jgi:hypothetical protein
MRMSTLWPRPSHEEQVFRQATLNPIEAPHQTLSLLELWLESEVACVQFSGMFRSIWKYLPTRIASGVELRSVLLAAKLCKAFTPRDGEIHCAYA